MTLFRPHQEADALAYAAAGGQALHLLAITPARLYDRNLPRLVRTARELGQRGVQVTRTMTAHQYVVIAGFPLIKACMNAQVAGSAVMVDVIRACSVGDSA